MMARVEDAIVVNVPVRTAYNQWTQFESFPRFMEGVKNVRQLDDRRLEWQAEIAGKDERWNAEITEQVPDQRVAWRSTSGALNNGVVTFQPADGTSTRVNLQLEYDPEGIVENMGDKMGFVKRRIQGDLKRFKEFIEARGQETGAWRGEIHGERVQSGQTGQGGPMEQGGGMTGTGSTTGTASATRKGTSRQGSKKKK
jgi:uncharacterized membrane protein